MKRLLFVLAVGCVFAVSSTSCKSHETCPAYGSSDVESEVCAETQA